MATPPVTPNPQTPVTNTNVPTPNAQGVSNPPAALPANDSTDPSQGANITLQSDPAANAAPTGQMVSNAPASSVQSQPSSSTAPNTPQASSPTGGLPPARSLNSPYANTVTPSAALAPTQPLPTNPSVIHGSVLHSVATALSGGPRYSTTIDQNGNTVRTQVPVSTAHLGMAIAMEFLGGMARGAGVPSGPGFAGRAAAAGFAGAQQDQKDAQQKQTDDAQQQFKNQVLSKAQQANNLEVASRTVLLNAQAEKEGLDNSKTLIAMDADAIQNAQDHGDVQETGVSQADILAGQKSGKYNAAQQSFYHDGVTTLNGHPEATFTVASNPNRPANMTQAQYDQYASYDIPGFTKGVKIPAGGYQVKQNMLDNWNRQVATQDTMRQETGDVVTHLAGSPAYKDQSAEVQSNLAKAWTDPVFKRAMVSALPSVSHSHPDEPMADAVARLGAPYVQNADGKWVPNSGARIAAAQAIYGGFGGGDTARGKQLLQDEKDATAPTTIKTLGQADGIIADPTSSPKAVADAQAAKVQMLADKSAGKAAKAGTGKGAVDGVPESTLVDQIARGQIAPTRWDYLLSKNPGLMAQVAAKDPNFDSSKASSYPQVYKDFTSGKTSIALNAGGTALGHLKELMDLNTDASHIPHTPAWTAYQNKAATVSTELAKFYGAETIPGIDKIEKTLTSTLPGNRGAAIRTQAQSMGDKLDAYEQQWKNAAPSRAYEAPMPGISDKAKAARAALDPNYTYTPSTQGSGSNSSLNPNPSTPQLHNGQHMVQVTIPAGASQVRDANKNVIGYMQNGQYTPIGGK